MSRYKDFEEKVFMWLSSKHDSDPSFTFSLRQKANKGAELDYFIGTKNSNYFGTTFWYIPVYFPGSSTDLINLMFTLTDDGYNYSIHFNQTTDPKDNQNRNALKLIIALKEELKKVFPSIFENSPEKKMFFFQINSHQKSYESVNNMLLDVESDLDKVIPMVDKYIEIYKQLDPDFKAGRYSESEFELMSVKLQRRLKNYSAAEDGVGVASAFQLNPWDEDQPLLNQPLNQILFGPPGTGKTFNTINKAVAIANPLFQIESSTRLKIHQEYDRLVENGLVQFCTFHQSMSYESFVEGIKPVYLPEERKLTYPTVPGIFKGICFAALKSTYMVNLDGQEEVSFDILWKRYIDHLKTTFKTDDYPFITKEKSELRPDKDELALGRIVAYYRWSNTSTKSAPGKTPFPIKPDKIKRMQEEGITENETNLKQRLKPILTYHLSPYYAVYKSFMAFTKANMGDNYEVVVEGESFDADTDQFNGYLEQLRIIKQQKTGLKSGVPHVLIIDEINRGNVSQIFGELITLLEEDKRFGKKEGLAIKLPYSQEEFAVPDNLYIIGTMNTADRSVEALDTALRRRFVFEELRPNPSLLHPKELILSYWNDERYIDLDYETWVEEPYKSLTDSFYELIGFDREAENLLLDNLDGVERKYWLLEDFKDFDDSLFDKGFRLDLLLDKINQRIEKLISQDQQVGHAFFINVRSLEDLYDVIYVKLIPQLQEYFYGDFGKVGLILGKSFVEVKNSKTLFADFEYEDKDLLLERKIYEINAFKSGDVIDWETFKTAVKNIYQPLIFN